MAHMHYKGTGKVHSFKGVLTDTAGSNQQKIRIQGPVGAIAWRINKFEIMSVTPMTTNGEHVVKVYREEQDTIVGTVNFNENELLAVGIWFMNEGEQYPLSSQIIFDNALFSRNIWVSHIDVNAAISCNYYIELEEVKVSAAGMAQLAVAAARRT